MNTYYIDRYYRWILILYKIALIPLLQNISYYFVYFKICSIVSSLLSRIHSLCSIDPPTQHKTLFLHRALKINLQLAFNSNQDEINFNNIEARERIFLHDSSTLELEKMTNNISAWSFSFCRYPSLMKSDGAVRSKQAKLSVIRVLVCVWE